MGTSGGPGAVGREKPQHSKTLGGSILVTNDKGPGMAQAWVDKRFLVTGASGFIGRAVCEKLLELGGQVHGISRSTVNNNHDGYTHWCADLTRSVDVDRAVEQAAPHYLLHLASRVTGSRELDCVRDTFAANLGSTVNLLVATQQSGVEKCVLAGSLEEPPDTEVNPVPASPYAASKWASSGYARMFHALYGTRVAVARIFMVYGPGQRDVRKLVPYVCLSSANAQNPKLMSGARPVDWIYIDDLVAGLLAMLEGGPEDGGYVELGTGQLTTTGEVAKRLCTLSGNRVAPDLGALADRAMEQVRCANVARTRKQIDWHPETSLDEGLRCTYEWYKATQDRGDIRLPGS
jgi:nucleoside-diphosphate-sugar epimerase